MIRTVPSHTPIYLFIPKCSVRGIMEFEASIETHRESSSLPKWKPVPWRDSPTSAGELQILVPRRADSEQRLAIVW